MDPMKEMLIEHQCAKLINRFFHLFNRDLTLVADLFTKDGTMDLVSHKVGPGPEAMREQMRPATVSHLESKEIDMSHVSNIVVDVIDETTAKGISYDLARKHVDKEGLAPGQLAPLPSHFYAGHWDDKFRLEEGVWKFSSRVLKLTYLRADLVDEENAK